MEATLTNTKTGEAIRLGGSTSASWGPVWSPDGAHVAFSSDEGGEAGIWVWDARTRAATRFPGVIARPFFGFELVRWTSDGQRLVAKILPNDLTIAQANALGRTAPRASSGFPPVAPGQPSVQVCKVVATTTDPAAATKPTSTERGAPVGDVQWAIGDLAVLDVRTRAVTRLVQRTAVRAWAISPDSRYVAYTVLKGAEPNAQQANLDLAVVELGGGASRTLALNARLGYGIEWSWSPDSRSIAYISSGQLGTGEIVVLQSPEVPSECHVITQAPNVIDFWNRRLDFFREHLDLVYDDKGAIVFDGERARSRGARASGQ